MSQTFNKKTTKKQKPTLKADPQHNSFVYAEERIHESDKKDDRLVQSILPDFLKNQPLWYLLFLL